MTDRPLRSVRAAYDTVAADYAAYFPTTEPEAPVDLAMLDHFVSLAGCSSTVLDAGCGAGRMARYLSDRGCRVAGIDLSPGMLAMAHRDHPDIPVAAGSITALPIADQSVDGAVYWYSIIHVPDEAVSLVLSETARVLRPGGHALFAFQTGRGVSDVGPAYRAFGHDVRLMRHSRDVTDLAPLIVDARLRVVAQFSRAPIDPEKDGQAFIIAQRPLT